MATDMDRERAKKSALPGELLDACARGELILCVGPELTRAGGLPSQAEIALALLDDAEGSRHLDGPKLREWIAAGRVEEALEALERRLGARFRRVVEVQLGARERSMPALARAIAALEGQLRAVYTTEVHRLLEVAFADAWPSFSTAQADLVRRRKLIIKLCGTLEFPETWALTRATREREFGERSLRRGLLAAAGRAHCLLFIGFDPNDELSERLFSIVAPLVDAGQAPAHFLALPQCSLEERGLLEGRGLSLLEADSTALLGALADAFAQGRPGVDVTLPGCPYPGLQAFDSSLAAVFHGRRAEVSAAASRLGGPSARHRRWLAIDGSSGVGKSSFVHAGVVPALERGFAEGTSGRWWVAKIRPGRHPLRALVEGLAATVSAETSVDLEQLFVPREDGTHDAAANVASFIRNHKPGGVALLVVVDQLEEVVTLARARERELFSSCLGALLQEELIYLVTTLRSDFSAAISASSPALGRLLNEQAERYTLAPISRIGLRLAIAEPAAQLGVAFEGELVERIAHDAAQHLGRRRSDEDGVLRTADAALPLVAHVLRGLWDAGAAEDRAILLAEYEALGGVSGALSRSADALLAGLDSHQRARARALLLGMVNLDGGHSTRRSLERAEAVALAGGGPEGEVLLRKLSGEGGPRVLVVRSEGSELVVEIVHEALLREWDSLRGWIAEDRAQLARDEALARRAAAWTAHGRSWRSLPRGPERRELMGGRPRGPKAEEQRSYQRAMRAALWVRGGVFGASLVALGGLGQFVALEQKKAADARGDKDVAVRDKRQADQDKALAEADRDRAKEREKIDAYLDSGRCREALERLVDGPPEFDDLLGRAASCAVVAGRIETARASTLARVTSLGVPSPDESELWVGHADGTLTRWREGEGVTKIELRDDEGEAIVVKDAIRAITFGDGGDRGALSFSGRTRVIDRAGRAVGPSVEGVYPSFVPGRRALVTRTRDKLYVHDTDDGESLASPVVVPQLRDYVLSPDGGSAVCYRGDSKGGELLRYALADGELAAPPIAVPGFPRKLAISPGGDLVATTADDNATRLWSLASGAELASPVVLKVESKTRKFVDFARGGEVLLTLQDDERVVGSDTQLRQRVRVEGIDAEVRPGVTFDGEAILTAMMHEPWVRLHSTTRDEELARLDAFDPDNDAARARRIAVSGGGERVHVVEDVNLVDGEEADEVAARVSTWALDRQEHWFLQGSRQGVVALAFALGEFDTLVFGSSDGELGEWTLGAAPSRAQLDGGVFALGAGAGGAGWAGLSRRGERFVWAQDVPELLDTGPRCEAKAGQFSARGDWLGLVCEDGAAQLWHLDGPRPEMLPLPAVGDAPQTRALALALSPGGSRFAVSCADGSIHRWIIKDAASIVAGPSVRADPSAIKALAHDWDGKHLVSGGSDHVLRVWTEGEAEPRTIETSQTIKSLAISADGRWVAAGSRHVAPVQVWDVEAQVSEDLEGCDSSTQALAFSPGGELLAAGCGDGSVHVWPRDPAGHRLLACQRLARTGEAPLSCVSKD